MRARYCVCLITEGRVTEIMAKNLTPHRAAGWLDSCHRTCDEYEQAAIVRQPISRAILEAVSKSRCA